MAEAPDPLTPLAESVADGADVDWSSIDQSAGNPDASVIRQLQTIAEIARLHRALSHGAEASVDVPADTSPSTPATAPPDGERWGPLIILEQLGSGAFADVYRAWDTSLDREVALKLLRRDERRPRGESIIREGQLLARVSHPNVMRVYGAQSVDGQVGIWAELLRGRTLARLVQEDGPLGAEEALLVGEALSRALAAVHKAGLLHRDVKAQNVMREHGGRIVLMDFGLGREVERSRDGGVQELAGTPRYMAPEVFAGSPASVQSDVYSLGTLLYFLVTGAFPIDGATLDELGEAHRQGRRHRLADRRPDLPTRFVQVVERALDPDPRRRYESAGAFQAALATAGHASAPTAPAATWFGRPLVILGAVLMAAAATWWITTTVTRPAPAVPLTFAIEPPSGTTFPDSSRLAPAIAPDGRTVAFAATDAAGTIRLWLHDFATGTSRVITDSVGAQIPFWAPDSQAVAFFEPGGALRRVSIEEGAATSSPLMTASEPRGGTWSDAGDLLFSRGPRSGLYRMAAAGDGTDGVAVTTPDHTRGELGHMWPQFLPGGQRFIFFVFSNDANVRGVYLGALDGSAARQLARSDSSGIIAGDAIVFAHNGTLVRQGVDWTRGVARGPQETIAPDVAVSYDYQTIATLSDNQTLVYLPAVETSELVWFTRQGAEAGMVALPPARYRSPAVSRDGRLLAVQRYRDALSEIVVFDLVQSSIVTTLNHSADVQFATWGPGTRLAYASIDRGKADVYVHDVRTDGRPQMLFSGGDTNDSDKMPMDWSTDGAFLTFVDLPREGEYGLWTVPLDDPASARPLRPAAGTQVSGRISPDGQYIVYARRLPVRRAGDVPERQVWLSTFPSGTAPRFVASGGIDLAWPSNREISFFDSTDRLTVVANPQGPGVPTTVAAFAPGVRTPAASRNSYSWAPDGTRVLVNRPHTQPGSVRLRVHRLVPS